MKNKTCSDVVGKLCNLFVFFSFHPIYLCERDVSADAECELVFYKRSRHVLVSLRGFNPSSLFSVSEFKDDQLSLFQETAWTRALPFPGGIRSALFFTAAYFWPPRRPSCFSTPASTLTTPLRRWTSASPTWSSTGRRGSSR